MTLAKDRLYKASLSVLLFFSVFIALGLFLNGSLLPALLFFVCSALFVRSFFKYKAIHHSKSLSTSISCFILWLGIVVALSQQHSSHQPLLLYAFYPLSTATFILLGIKRSSLIIFGSLGITIYLLAQNYHLAVVYQALAFAVFWVLLCILFSYLVSLEKKLEQATTTDALTGCSAISQFKKQLEAITTFQKRYKNPLTCLRLKAINHAQNYHDKEKYIVEVAQICQSRIRQTDIICHYADGCFLILLPNTGIDSAHTLANDLIQACDAYNFSYIKNQQLAAPQFGYDLSSYSESQAWEIWFSQLTENLPLTNR